MALENLSLATLEKSTLQPLFQTAMNEVLFSLAEEADVRGDRSITIKLTMKPKDGYVITEMSCKAAVPGRTVAAITTLEDQRLKIDTVSGDPRQPDLLEHAGTNVASFNAAKSAKGVL